MTQLHYSKKLCILPQRPMFIVMFIAGFVRITRKRNQPGGPSRMNGQRNCNTKTSGNFIQPQQKLKLQDIQENVCSWKLCNPGSERKIIQCLFHASQLLPLTCVYLHGLRMKRPVNLTKVHGIRKESSKRGAVQCNKSHVTLMQGRDYWLLNATMMREGRIMKGIRRVGLEKH